MGLFDKFKKKNELLDNEQNEEIEALGWDAIDKLCDKVYPNQKNPKHYGAMIKWRLGGNDPLDGISVYDGGDYWHFITYGLSELYEKESEDKEWSGYGMELTLKLKKDHYENEEDEIRCICGILQSIARITFTQGELFNAYEYLYTGQTTGIDIKGTSNITGFITIPDDKFVEIKKSLTSFPTTISYVLVSDENIKSGYNLAGKKYSEQTTSEQELLKNLKRDFNTKIDNVSEKVSKKIQELEEEKSDLAIRKFLLGIDLLATKE